MAFDFPIPLSIGEVFVASPTKSYIWSGEVWSSKYKEPPAGTAHPPAETIPVDPPIDGADSVDAVLRNLSVEVDQLATESGNKVDVAGDTMTGFLILSADPTDLMHAATKQYVDAIGAGLPLGGNPGEALVLDATGVPAWGAPINSGAFVTAATVTVPSGGLQFGKNELPRWSMSLGDLDDNSDFQLRRFNDGGGSMGAAIRVSRRTGDIEFDTVPTVKGKKLVDISYIEKLERRIAALEKGKR